MELPTAAIPYQEYTVKPSIFPIYVVLCTFLKPQMKPRVDTLELACDFAKGVADEGGVRRSLTTGIYGYGYTYESDSFHTSFQPWALFFGKRTFLKISDFYRDAVPRAELRGNCDDFSNLFQVLCAALGVEAKTLGIGGVFKTKSVLPIGRSQWEIFWDLNHHQVGLQEPNFVYDPTYKLWPDIVALGMKLEPDYKALLFDGGTWKPQKPDKVDDVE